jgi:hypothetical protein
MVRNSMASRGSCDEDLCLYEVLLEFGCEDVAEDGVVSRFMQGMFSFGEAV